MIKNYMLGCQIINNNVNINYVNDKFVININIGHFGIRSEIELHNTCCYGTYC
ncbi:MAG TPA: hypothetical protein K8V91_07910 [[Clostridium] spiroforme]|uniref:Uncharacterized protein n=1 Tax=Thomasclavelia spiroformis TaxID=29348 RepID=A0A921GCP3_9FIRM|nr:hypothetical protein [Thomasclavelia spiroformis]